MFKLIGAFVVMAVLFIGYPALTRWYSGDLTPKETVEEVRFRVGESLITEGKQDTQPQNIPEKSLNSPRRNEDTKDSLSSDDILKKLMKD